MNKKLNTSTAVFLFVIGLFFFLAPAVQAVNLQDAFLIPTVQAVNLKDAFSGQLSTVGERSGFNVSQRNVEPIIGTIISVVLSFLGVIFLVLMIYGGYMWMTAAGNEEKAKKARQLIQAAVLGLIVVVGAYAITVFIMGRIAKDLISGGAYDASKGSQDTGATGCCAQNLAFIPELPDFVCTSVPDESSCRIPPMVGSSAVFYGEDCSGVPECNGCCVQNLTFIPELPDFVCTTMSNDSGCRIPPMVGSSAIFYGEDCSALDECRPTSVIYGCCVTGPPIVCSPQLDETTCRNRTGYDSWQERSDCSDMLVCKKI